MDIQKECDPDYIRILILPLLVMMMIIILVLGIYDVVVKITRCRELSRQREMELLI